MLPVEGGHSIATARVTPLANSCSKQKSMCLLRGGLAKTAAVKTFYPLSVGFSILLFGGFCALKVPYCDFSTLNTHRYTEGAWSCKMRWNLKFTTTNQGLFLIVFHLQCEYLIQVVFKDPSTLKTFCIYNIEELCMLQMIFEGLVGEM